MDGMASHEAFGPEAGVGPRIAILGAGMSGIAMGARLKQAGFTRFTIYEKSDGFGGTWRDNTYPGCGCDVPSHLYSYSFHPKPDWSEKWSGQAEILAYFEETARHFGLEAHARFGTEITECQYHEASATWSLTDADGNLHTADLVVSGLGQLNIPHIPAFPGRERFAGPQFHSARWDHSVDLEGKRVVVVGNGPSAVQFVPEIAPVVGRLINFQRSPAWVRDRGNIAYTEKQKAAWARSRWRHDLYRWWIWVGADLGFIFFKKNSPFAGMMRKRCEDHLKAQVADPALRETLTPDFTPGCKRILISDDYYPALARENVEVLRQGVVSLDETGVIGEDGTHVACDVVIYATGFQSTDFLTPMQVTGRGGQRLSEAWADGAEAYKGITVAGFPNFFLLYGPNTNLGHNSIIFMVEQQVDHIIALLKEMARRGADRVEVTAEAQARFNETLQRELDQTVWASDCASWYKTETGRITNNWSRRTKAYRKIMRELSLGDYRLAPAGGAGKARAQAAGEAEPAA